DGAGAYPDGSVWLYLRNAEDRDDGWGEKWDPSADLAFLRCLFGNPFRPASLDPAWMTPTLRSLAQAAFDQTILPSGDLDPACLAVLADALEEAGCTDETILSHLRDPGPHVPGCFGVAAILGRS